MARLEWQIGTVVEIRTETPRVKSLVIDLPDRIRHQAGQHVDVRLTAEDGYQAQRSYSIASPPEDKYVTLTVEYVDDGEVSPYLIEVLQKGYPIELRGPIGGYFVWSAVDAKDDGPPLLLVAGGSGVAPLMAMLRHRANAASKVPTTLLYSSRNHEEVIFREELDRLAANDPSLRIIHTLTRQQPEDWTGYARRIDPAMLAEVAWPTTLDPLAFVCGPTALVETVANYLQEFGYDPGRIKTERFGPSGG